MALSDLILQKRDLSRDGDSGGSGIKNLLMEQRNVANHPFLSRLHDDALEAAMPDHPASAAVRLSGKLEALDRILPKLKAGGHRVLLFCTMTRMLDVLEDYLSVRIGLLDKREHPKGISLTRQGQSLWQ